MSAPKKRPYVRPRVGSTMLRSLWYLFAFAGVLAVALVLPSSPEKRFSVEGDWELEASRAVADLPPGRYELLVTGQRYALHYEVAEGGDGVAGLELGRLQEQEDGSLVLDPDVAAYRLNGGAWSDEPREPRRLQVAFRDGRLQLSDREGDSLSGRALSGGAAPR